MEEDFKKNYFREKEHNDLTNDTFMQSVMEKIEKRRNAFKKKYPVYTQKYLAEKAGVSLATYKNYLRGYNTGFSLRTLKNIADALKCKPSDFLD